MHIYRRHIFSAVLSVITMLLMTVSCRDQSAEVQIPLENKTVLLGERAQFFCQVLGNRTNLRIRVNGALKKLGINDAHRGIYIRFLVENNSSTNSLNITKVYITIEGTKNNNNSVLECYDTSLERESIPTATLTVRGGPAEPEVSYDFMLDNGLVMVSWPHPFTWENYSITGYQIGCRDIDTRYSDIRYNDTITNDTLEEDVVTLSVKLPLTIPECYTLQCNVTVFNALGNTTAVTNGSTSQRAGLGPKPAIQLVKSSLSEVGKPEVAVCVQLPVLCRFQSINYTVTISLGGDTVLEIGREFFYSSGYSSECVEETVPGGLDEGTEYTVQVFVDAGDSGNAYSEIETFKPQLRPESDGCPTTNVHSLSGGNASSADSEDTSNTGVLVDVALGVVLLIVIIILLVFACIILGLYRALKSYHRFSNISQHPGTPNRMFDAYSSLSKLDTDISSKKPEPDPVYHILEAPTSPAPTTLAPHSPPPSTPAPHSPEGTSTATATGECRRGAGGEEPLYHNPITSMKKK